MNWKKVFATLLVAAIMPVAAGRAEKLSIVTGSVELTGRRKAAR